MPYDKVERLLTDGKVVLLDGAFGTELRRRHVPGIDDPHIWSARGLLNSPTTVLDIHRDYLLAGADVITAGAFRTNSRALRKAGLDYLSRSLTRFAVSLALEMRSLFGRSWDFAVAGNVTSLEDCYTPAISPGASALREHQEKVQYLAEAGADFILFESIPSIQEAVAALRAVEGYDLPVWLSLVLSPDSDGPELLDGTPVAGIQAVLEQAGRKPDVLLFNCCTPEAISRALPVLANGFSGTIGAYANVEKEYEIGKPWKRRVELRSRARTTSHS
jgi:homocysteine S-methyltransferase